VKQYMLNWQFLPEGWGKRMIQISTWQLYCLMMLFEIGSTTVFGLGIDANEDAWLAILTAMFFGFLLIWLFTELHRRYPDRNLIEIIQQNFGKWLAIPLAMLYGLEFFWIATLNFREFGELISMILLPNIPLAMILIIFMLTVVYVLFLGCEVLARMGEIMFPIVVFFIIATIFLISASGEVSLHRLQPVLGNGLSQVYPRRHATLARQIIDNGGTLVSEFPLITPPLPAHFPRRNRIISGLSLGVLVIEAALRCGSLVTVRCALEQGRDVFALPGPIGNPGSEGPHWLIKQGAVPVTSPEDIVEYWQNELAWLTDTSDSINNCADQPSVALPFPELLANVGDEVTPVDVVAERAGQSVPVTVAQLLELELAGWIAAVPGGYVRLRRASHVRRTHVFV